MRKFMSAMIATSAVATVLGCTQPPQGDAVVTRTSHTGRACGDGQADRDGRGHRIEGTERVEKGSGRIDSPAKLTGKLKLTNSSTDQTVRLIGGKILYIDEQGQIIKIGEARTEPTLKFPSSYNTTDRLDPGQDATQTVEVDFPAEALQAKKLKEIRIELAYIPSSYKLQTANFSVSIGGQ